MAIGARSADATGASRVRAIPTALARGAFAAAAVGLAGGIGSLTVVSLALIAGLCFFLLGWRGRQEATPPSQDRFAEVLQAAFLVALCGAAWDNRHGPRGLPDPGWVELAGMALTASGLLLRQRAAAALGRHFTVRMAVAPDHRLVTTGPYRLLRHPNYAALALIMLGVAVTLQSRLAFLATALLCIPAIVVRALQEESLLARHLGPAYQSYARRTWRLVPGVF